ncbi:MULTISPECIES: tRNA (N6-isopentenyl adenosine(37)-C2)-methylthiotransferase MiaB [Brevibacterium]|uniref:tRNA-2-methylthio-N(6)-dimethylallyladenosine synthase n=1 Tax=Brevibacterium casei TaxID=33889 RepID=A0AB34XRK2_9MICO|nr:MULTISPECIES: tRNA (N6-isopentenyl adenosine(37)-C2)-methylthiotransferase MiaB [Brevibacterium]KZE15975.1 tRNA-2-methylthio-N(6)-dimethylallyladenosine synthase MiaB [Brevibacterium casei]MCM1014280.1 tRNA (N6-isopentenyl adenosine(37)-C2)-methylthiotransferase MiaB [Brevibacterium sp. XM4083]MCT1447668.1 tRNA (N6-isopentenyl adenosine(37)-C2)-methylthiotransferase MiaB [Brevibacterium casei]MCT1550710.1 tRNA (N6-isopentenyl adenosine(37)-C2)-methylthiotransferase MiaB [Brevibacterium casei
MTELIDAPHATDAHPRSYEVKTYGCQMNVHDSERLSGLLDDAGYVPADVESQADVVVFNTCAVRENADNRLYGNLGRLAKVKEQHPGLQIAVGGCMAQKDRDTIVKKAPWVDVVFGTHNMGSLPALLERARHNDEAQVEILESLDVFPSTLPSRRESQHSGWVSISVGCNNTCTFCIVPSLRGKEKDRRPGDILAEVEALVADGVVEVTLLGQNVNSYGAEFRDKGAFAKLLRAVGNVEGIERVRFTSPHPAAFSDDVIEAMAETPTVMPQLHMPLQSGSDRILKAMRRSYRTSRFMRILDSVRDRIPNAAITTDIIVGFPGETEEDFAGTMDIVRRARFSQAFTFQYSIRPGTPAATMPDQLPKEVVQERFERLIALQDEIAWEENRALIGTEVDVLVTGLPSADSPRLSGRAADNRLVHVGLPDGTPAPRPGDFVTATVTDAKPYFLLADTGYSVRPSRAGDAYDRAQADSCGAPSPGSSAGGATVLGMPTIRPRS